MSSETRHYLVSGRVQGVGYRAGTATEARARGLDGWVRNLADGRVEALARGEPETLRAFEDWLRHGPRGAAVSDMIMTVVEAEIFPGFKVRNDA